MSTANQGGAGAISLGAPLREAGRSCKTTWALWGTPMLHMGWICSRIPGYAHPLPRLCVSAGHHRSQRNLI